MKPKFSVRSKIWIEDGSGHVAFGLGRLRILETIDRTGSMSAAAKELKMSYRAVWCRIRESEERIGRQLVIRKGKGSVLTAFSRALMRHFEELQTTIIHEADIKFSRTLYDSFADDS